MRFALELMWIQQNPIASARCLCAENTSHNKRSNQIVVLFGEQECSAMRVINNPQQYNNEENEKTQL